MTIDKELMHLLNKPSPQNAQAVMDLVGDVMPTLYPRLVSKARKYKTGLDPEAVVSDAITKALEILHKQLCLEESKELSFKYDGTVPFEAWVFLCLGGPGLGARSGVFGNLLKKNKTHKKYISSEVDIEERANEDGEFIRNLSVKIDIEAMLSCLDQQPYGKLTIILWYQLFEGEANEALVERTAKQVGLTKDAVAIKRRAKTVFKDGPRKRLTIPEIAVLIDETEYKVRSIRDDALLAIRASNMSQEVIRFYG